MIRERIVLGLRDAALAEKLQLDKKLTLEKAITRAREAEAVRQQQPVVRGEETKKPEIPAIQKENSQEENLHTSDRREERQSKDDRQAATDVAKRQCMTVSDVLLKTPHVTIVGKDTTREYVDQIT